jgi:uncharacterized protein (DUF1015 family)
VTTSTSGLRLLPFRAVRPAVDRDRLGRLLCPPYDVIDAETRRALLAADPDNAVSLILPTAEDGDDPYARAAELLRRRVDDGLYQVDETPALYVYEMSDRDGATTRGLLGAVELRAPEDGVILPHEDTMAGPVADRLALMTATEADLEPIYLVYDGGGAASATVAGAAEAPPIAMATTPDGITHRLWAITDVDVLAEIAADLGGRTALIADGHHRYATYRQLQANLRAERGTGPWDFGLTLLVDATAFGPQVHAIHRALPTEPLSRVLERLASWADVTDVASPEDGLARAGREPGFAAVLADGDRTVLLRDPDGRLAAASSEAGAPGEPGELAGLDVTVVHRGLIRTALGIEDTVDSVRYAHSISEALAAAPAGTAVLLRPTPVAAVAAVARAGARMPRKSTLFTPKPASGLVLRRFADER